MFASGASPTFPSIPFFVLLALSELATKGCNYGGHKPERKSDIIAFSHTSNMPAR